MEWQAVVMALQILMLAVGWTLFQKARAELSAKAAEEPVLSEVRALQRQVKELLTEIEEAGDAVTAKVEGRCAEARELLIALEHRLEAVQEAAEKPAAPKRNSRRAAVPDVVAEVVVEAPVEAVVQTPRSVSRRASKTTDQAPETVAPAATQAARSSKRTSQKSTQVAQASLPTESLQTRSAGVPSEESPSAPELSSFALRRNAVYALADQGELPAAIARQTGLSEGEVETLLGLRLQQR